MADCEGTGILEGGVIKDSQILSSVVTASTIETSVLNGCELRNTTSLDATTAKAILDALVALGPDQLATLANLLLTSGSAISNVDAPAKQESPANPTEFYGSKTTALGAPATWGNIGGYAVPMYSRS